MFESKSTSGEEGRGRTERGRDERGRGLLLVLGLDCVGNMK